MKFNEDSRVKIPSILHLCRPGYEYILLKNANWDTETNVLMNFTAEPFNKRTGKK